MLGVAIAAQHPAAYRAIETRFDDAGAANAIVDSEYHFCRAW